MARLLSITVGLAGGLNSSLELARRAVDQGHEVSFLGHRDVGETISQAGFEYVRVRADERAMLALRHEIDRVGRLRALPLARRLRNEVVNSTEIADAVGAIAPDALIIDVEAHYAIIATHALGLPTLTKSDFFSMRHQRGVPPLHSLRPMPTTVRERLVVEAEWAQARATRIATKTIGELHPRQLARRLAPFRYNTVARRDLKAVAKARRLNLATISSQAGWLWPQTYPALPLVSATPRELDLVSQTSANDRWVGPLIPSSRPEPRFRPDERQAWQAFSARNRAENRPLVYCSFGTILPDTSELLRVVIGAARLRPDWDVVIGMGARGDFESLAAADNLLVLEFAPQLEVLERADLSIIHGGINGILESVNFGVPMIVEQHGPGDGPGNATRVAHAGLGVRTSIADLEPAALVTMVDEMLQDDRLHARLNDAMGTFADYRREGALESALSELLTGTI